MRPSRYIRSAIAATLALAMVVALPQQTVAHPSRKAKIERLHHQLHKARVRNHRLRRTLAQRTAERDQARASIATAPPPPATPSPLAAAVEQVSHEIAYTENSVPGHRDMLIAYAAMTYVNGHVSAPAYGFGIHPEATADSVLRYGAGICGHAALTYAAIVKRFGVPVRSVQFYYANGGGHIAVEAFYEGDWHFFDPTWGAYYADTDVLSITEIRARQDASSLLHENGTLFWHVVQDFSGGTTDLPLELDPVTRVEIDKQPFID